MEILKSISENRLSKENILKIKIKNSEKKIKNIKFRESEPALKGFAKNTL